MSTDNSLEELYCKEKQRNGTAAGKGGKVKWSNASFDEMNNNIWCNDGNDPLENGHGWHRERRAERATFRTGWEDREECTRRGAALHRSRDSSSTVRKGTVHGFSWCDYLTLTVLVSVSPLKQLASSFLVKKDNNQLRTGYGEEMLKVWERGETEIVTDWYEGRR